MNTKHSHYIQAPGGHHGDGQGGGAGHEGPSYMQ